MGLLRSLADAIGARSTLAEVADMAAFLASDRASGMTGTIANLTGGMIVD